MTRYDTSSPSWLSPEARELAAKLGLAFRDPTLLETALTHSSYLNENPGYALGSNERLEFLGDAVIGLITAQELCRRLPEANEGSLTRARSRLVRSESLAGAAQRLGLGGYLRMGHGEEGAGGRQRESNLEATLEAVVGAAFLDGGYGAARKLVTHILEEQLDSLVARGVRQDPKSRLQEVTQRRGLGLPQYEMVEASGPEHIRTFAVVVRVNGEALGRGTGRRKADAERAAAREALKRLS
jgi:ribonuclease-3